MVIHFYLNLSMVMFFNLIKLIYNIVTKFTYILICIILNKILKFIKERPLLSLVFAFGLWVNSLPLPDSKTVDCNQFETTTPLQTILFAGGDGFVNPSSTTRGCTPEGAADRGSARFEGHDSSPKLPAEGSFGNNDNDNNPSFNTLEDNEVPDKEDWDFDAWVDEDDDSCNNSEKLVEPEELPVPVDFKYEKDSNGNPALLVPNQDSTSNIRKFNRVEYDQVASHLNHAKEFGVPMPPDFDMVKYQSLSKSDRIEYAKKHLSPGTIISYQNAIGRSMKPIFGTGSTTHTVRGFAGKHRTNVGLIIQSIPGTNKYYLSIINDRGVQVSSYSITENKLKRIIKDGFWILQERTFN